LIPVVAACCTAAVLLPAAVGRQAELTFQLARPAEVALEMQASAPGTSWGKTGAEAAVVRVEVDGAYNQHVVLFMGGEMHDYNLLLGPLAAGQHRVLVRLDPMLSSPGAKGFQALLKPRLFEPGAPEFEAMRYAPILYARPDTVGHATDTPLLAYYEWLPPSADAPKGSARVLRYSYIFSNEDAGTNTPALMARWGRTTDIEHVYRVFFGKDGAELGAIFQAVEHKETPFRGEKLGSHLLIGVASRNNNFSDRPVSRVRFALLPEAADLSQHSREEVMDQHPWSYQVMAAEMEREGKLAEIGDLRNYLYLEARVRTAASAASFGVVLSDGRAFRSDQGRADRRIERSDWVRSTVQLPPGASLNDLRSLVFYCDPPEKPPKQPATPACSIEAVSKMFFLGRDFLPGRSVSIGSGLPRQLAPGSSVSLDLPRSSEPAERKEPATEAQRHRGSNHRSTQSLEGGIHGPQRFNDAITK
jgi:hypothetical protein